MDILDRAIIFATQAHSGTNRKGTNLPYIVHPLEAAAIAATLTDDREVIAAAVLHDTLEDTSATADEIRQSFGERIALLVGAESENKREDRPAADTWKLRKQETLDHLEGAGREILILTLADKLSNIRAIARDYASLGEKLWERFNQKDKNEHAWYYSGIARCLKELQGTAAYEEYCSLVKRVFFGGERR